MTDPLEELEKELYGKKKSERIGKYRLPLKKKIKEEKEEAEKKKEEVIPPSRVRIGFVNVDKKYFSFSFILNILIYLSLFALIGVSAFIIYLMFFTEKGVEELKISFVGPNEVNPLETYTYKLLIENRSNQNLLNAELKIFLSQGVYFKNNPKEKTLSLSLGNIEKGNSYFEDFEILFLNEGNEKENIQVSLTYKLENKIHTFEKNQNFSVLVKNSPLKTQIFFPSKVYVNQDFQTSLQVINLTREKLYKLKIYVEPPSYFNLKSSFPESQNFYWEFPTIDPGEVKEISFIGQVQDVNSSGLIQVRLEFSWDVFSFSLSKEIFKINLLENPVYLSIKANPDYDSVPIGSSLFYNITVINKSQTILENNELKITFEGPFDINSLHSDGYFNTIDQALYWNSRNKPELLRLNPGDKVDFNLSISLVKEYPISSEKQKDFTFKVKAEFKTPTIPPELETGGKEYKVVKENTKKILGDLWISHELVYNDPIFPGTGPLPLRENFPTTLAWHIKIRTVTEDFENLVITTKLPIGVNLTGRIGGDTLKESITYDPKTGNFIYNLNKVPANLGITQREMDLIFEVGVIPPGNINLDSFVIIPPLQYSAKGSFSQIQISRSVEGIISRFIK